MKDLQIEREIENILLSVKFNQNLYLMVLHLKFIYFITNVEIRLNFFRVSSTFFRKS